MEAVLNKDGNFPSEKDKFVRLVIISAKTTGNLLITEVGMKSTGDDFGGIALIIFSTSSAVTGVIELNFKPKYRGSGNVVILRKVSNVLATDRFRLIILS